MCAAVYTYTHTNCRRPASEANAARVGLIFSPTPAILPLCPPLRLNLKCSMKCIPASSKASIGFYYICHHKQWAVVSPKRSAASQQQLQIQLAGATPHHAPILVPLFFCDFNNHRIQVFRYSDGTHLRSIGSLNLAGNGQFYQPFSIAFDGAGHIIVSELYGSRVQVLRYTDGAHVRTFGSKAVAKDNSPVLPVLPSTARAMLLHLTAATLVCKFFG
jgi:hypothetical protein